MTFQETQTLISEINNIAIWSRYIEHERAKEVIDYEEIERMTKWLEEAKQVIFERCTK